MIIAPPGWLDDPAPPSVWSTHPPHSSSTTTGGMVQPAPAGECFRRPPDPASRLYPVHVPAIVAAPSRPRRFARPVPGGTIVGLVALGVAALIVGSSQGRAEGVAPAALTPPSSVMAIEPDPPAGGSTRIAPSTTSTDGPGVYIAPSAAASTHVHAATEGPLQPIGGDK